MPSLAPFSLLTIYGLGFDSTANVAFSFGPNPSIVAWPLALAATSLTVVVPPLAGSSGFSTGAVGVSVVQSSGRSSSVQLTIGPVAAATSLRPGTVTMGFIQGISALATQLAGDTNTSPYASTLKSLISAVNGLIPPIQDLMNGNSSTVSLGSVQGRTIVMGQADLVQVDRLLIELLQTLPHPGGGVPSGLNATTVLNRMSRGVRRAGLALQLLDQTGGGCASGRQYATSLYEVLKADTTVSVSFVSGGVQNLSLGFQNADETTFKEDLQLLAGIANIAVNLSPGVIVLFGEFLPPGVVVGASLVGVWQVAVGVRRYLDTPDASFSEKVTLTKAMVLLSRFYGAVVPGTVGPIMLMWSTTAKLADFMVSQPIPTTTPRPSPIACFSAAGLDFGSTPIPTPSALQSVSLTNIGTAALALEGIAKSGDDEGDFQENDNCGASLAPGASCILNIVFTPKSSGAKMAAITIYSNAPTVPPVLYLGGSGTLQLTPVLMSISLNPGGIPASSPMALRGFAEESASGVTVTTDSPALTDVLTVPGGTPVYGTVTLSGPAPPGGISVAIQAGGSAARVGASSVLIGNGQNTAIFTITTATVSAPIDVLISASLTTGAGTVVKTASLTLTAAARPLLSVLWISLGNSGGADLAREYSGACPGGLTYPGVAEVEGEFYAGQTLGTLVGFPQPPILWPVPLPYQMNSNRFDLFTLDSSTYQVGGNAGCRIAPSSPSFVVTGSFGSKLSVQLNSASILLEGTAAAGSTSSPPPARPTPRFGGCCGNSGLVPYFETNS